MDHTNKSTITKLRLNIGLLSLIKIRINDALPENYEKVAQIFNKRFKNAAQNAF